MSIASLYTDLIAVQMQLTSEAPSPKKETITIKGLTEKYEAIAQQLQKSSVVNKPALVQRVLEIGKRIEDLEKPSDPSSVSKAFRYIRGVVLSTASRLLPQTKKYAPIVREQKQSLKDKHLSETAVNSLEALIDRFMGKLDSTMTSLGISNPEHIAMLAKANLLQMASNILGVLNEGHAFDPCALLRPFEKILAEIHKDITSSSQGLPPQESLASYAPQLTETILSLAFPKLGGKRQFAIPPSTLGYVLENNYVFSMLKNQLLTWVIEPGLRHLDKAFQELENPSQQAPQLREEPTTSTKPTAPESPGLGKRLFHALQKARKASADKIAATLKKKENKDLITRLSTQLTQLIITIIPELRPFKTMIEIAVRSYVVKFGSLLMSDPSSVLNEILPIFAEELSKPKGASQGSLASRLARILDVSVDNGLKEVFRLMRDRLKLNFSLPPRKFLSNLKWIILYRAAGCFIPWFVRRRSKVEQLLTLRGRAKISLLKKESGKYAKMVAEGVLGKKGE